MKKLVIDVDCYIEDGEVNGISDSPEKMLMPFLNKTGRVRDGNWKVEVDILTGKVKNWPKGTHVLVYYKVCDSGIYTVKDETDKEIFSYEGYVPKCLDFYNDSFGDYLIFKINNEGVILDWDSDAVLEWAVCRKKETNNECQ